MKHNMYKIKFVGNNKEYIIHAFNMGDAIILAMAEAIHNAGPHRITEYVYADYGINFPRVTFEYISNTKNMRINLLLE